MDFLVVGAQKCSTSWLYYCLRDHPDVHLPQKKLERVYLGGELHKKKSDSWYFDFVGEGKEVRIKGDVSVDYMFDPRSAEAVFGTIGPVKIVASLRDPIDRAVSAYFWHLRQGDVEELNPNKGLRKAVEKWKKRSSLSTYNSEEHYANIIGRGCYSAQLQRYMDKFGSELIYITYYADIRQRSVETLSRLYSALGVDPEFKPSSLSRRPKQNSYSRPLLRLERATPNNAFFSKVADIANQALCWLGLGNEKPEIYPQVKNALRSLYEPSNQRLKELVCELPRSNVLTPGDTTPPWMNKT
ncbi:sulfotransferase domain-containing protein [Salinibacter ruber]|uniref:sulfotransferase domain-containing protein n=1 Tax=Salinibacter ruber TaxID=146919 RepID=UPI0021686A4E|nr:sulfotransferase domain-containing protein [Salinibacter ruber]MCS3638179.1 hypothetical protein [Salinibacter ruber]